MFGLLYLCALFIGSDFGEEEAEDADGDAVDSDGEKQFFR